MMKLIITIIVDGENMMGEPLCQVRGFVRDEKYKELKYDGPVTSAKDVAEAVMSLFEEMEK